MEVNTRFLAIWMTTISIGMFQMGYAVGMLNNLNPFFYDLYQEKADTVIEDRNNFNSIINTLMLSYNFSLIN